MTGPTLFDIDPTVGHARNTDPSTSHDAAAQASIRPQALRILRTLVELERQRPPSKPGATSSELQAAMLPAGVLVEKNIIARRLCDLDDAGYIEHASDDAGALVRMGNAGRFQQVWQSTETGRKAAAA